MNYLIIGDDAYLREREEDKIRKKFLPSDGSGANYSVYRTNDMDGIMDSLRTMPFLAEKRVVLVKEPEKLPDDSLKSLVSYLEDPSGASILVISAESAFKKNKHYRKLASLMSMIDADIPKPHTMKRWIRDFLKKENVDISREAVDLIVELKGQDTAGIKTELDKLIAYSGGNRVEAEHVEQLVGRSVTETVFKLVDAIDSGNAEWAFRILNDLYDQKKQPPEIIGYLAWYMRMMQGITLLSSKGASMDEMASELRHSPGYIKRLSYQAKKYDPSRISRRVSLLFEADKEIKTGRKDPAMALEMLITNFLTTSTS